MVPLWQKILIWTLGQTVVCVGEDHQVAHLPGLLTLGTRGAVGEGICDVLQSITTSPSSSYLVWVGTLPQFLDPWRSITSSKFVLNMVKGHHLQLSAMLYYYIILHLCKIKAGTAHHPIIHKDLDELLTKVPLNHHLVVLAFLKCICGS